MTDGLNLIYILNLSNVIFVTSLNVTKNYFNFSPILSNVVKLKKFLKKFNHLNEFILFLTNMQRLLFLLEVVITYFEIDCSQMRMFNNRSVILLQIYINQTNSHKTKKKFYD
jgi:hypothetical protein